MGIGARLREIAGIGAIVSAVLAVGAATLTATAVADPPPASPDRLSITAPAHARASTPGHHPYAVTVSGYASQRARLLVFIDYDGCLATPQKERAHGGPSAGYWVHGAFARRSLWESSVRREDHVCAYLVDPASGIGLVQRFAAFAIR